MSLPPSARDYAGQLLCFEPWPGWGWYRLGVNHEDSPLDYAEVDAAGVFHIRVHHFFDFEGALRGLVGRVEQQEHLFDGLWVATWTMLVGKFDFVERLCWRWDIELGPTQPRVEGWPVAPTTPPAYGGTGGVLAVSQTAIAKFKARMGE